MHAYIFFQLSQNRCFRGFDGYITSDCDADADVFNKHNFTATPEETVRAVLRAGTDVDCGGFVSQHAQSALDKGEALISSHFVHPSLVLLICRLSPILVSRYF